MTGFFAQTESFFICFHANGSVSIGFAKSQMSATLNGLGCGDGAKVCSSMIGKISEERCSVSSVTQLSKRLFMLEHIS
jgi:hypothetical protein